MRPQRFMLLQIGLLLFCFGHCFAQTKVPSLEYIEAQKASLAASSELTEARKNAAKLLYDEALQKLNEAKKHIAEREAIIAEAKKAPLELKKIQGELANDQNSSLPIGSPTTPTTELEKKLADAQSTEQVAGRSLSELKKDLQKRTLRKTELPALIVDEKKRVSDLELLIQKPIPAGEFPELVSAKQTLLVVLKKEAEEKLKFLEVEQESFDVQFGLLQARALLEEKRKARAEAIGRVWQTLLDDRRKVEAEKSKVDAENARKVAEDAHPIIQEVAERNAALTSRTVEIVQNTTIINQEVERARKHLKSISDDEEDSKKRIQAVGLTDAIGVLLRQHRGRLPTKRNFAQNIAARKAATTKVLLERFELEEENASTIDIESTVKSYFAKIEETLTPTKRARIEFLLRKNLNERRKHIDDFVARSDNYVAAMVDLDTVEKQTISRSIEYAGFIDERVLWIRSTTPIWQTDFKTIGQAFGALFSLKNWSAASYDVWQGVEEQSFLAGLCVLGLLLLGVARFLIVNHVFSADLQAAKATSFVPTIQSFLASALSAIFVPIIVWTVGRWFSNAPAPAAFTTAVGNALQSTASLIFVLNFLRRLLRPGGLGESHFSWKNPSIILVRKNLHWFIPVFIPAVFTRNFFDVSLNDQWHSSAGRLALMVVLGALAVFLGRILQPSKGLLANAPPEKTDWFIRFRGLWYMIAIILPMSLLVLTALGYHYTALELLKRLDATAGVMLVLVMIQALISRSIIVGRRKIAMKQAQERRNDVADTAVGAATTTTPPTERIDVFVVDAQSRQLLKSFMVVATILGIWYVWVDVLPALEALREFELWHYEGSAAESVIGADGKARIVQIPVTLADLSFCLISFFLTVLAVKNIPGAMEVAILQRLPMHQSSRYAITTVARYIIAIFGVTLALGQIGFFWSKLQWLIAAMGVGLGFGLQEVFGNFVCGLILLFERRIRVGDVVTIGDVSGKVLRVKVLATIVRDWSHKEYIVPNKDIITGRLSNWTLTNAINRVVIMTGLAYGSDTQQARSILLRIADSHPEILKDPGPIATFEGFEDSALNIQLRCYLSDLENRLAVTTNLYESIDEEFKKAGIEIAFPQRDIHIRTNMEPSSQPGIRVQTKES